MTETYRVGCIGTTEDDIRVVTMPQVLVGAGAVDRMLAADGTDFPVVPAGKIFKIGWMFVGGAQEKNLSLGYDDDGAGTNYVMLVPDLSVIMADSAAEWEIPIFIPAGKYFVHRNELGGDRTPADLNAFIGVMV